MMEPDLDTTTILVLYAFGGLKDKAGIPMAHHCTRVASYVQPRTWLNVTVALLHDIVEDTHVDLKFLTSLNYPAEVLEAVRLLTHDKKEMDYQAYIDRLCTSGNATAIRVKLADQRDNLDPKRWLHLNRYEANALRKRYAGVQQKLQEALDELEHSGQAAG